MQKVRLYLLLLFPGILLMCGAMVLSRCYTYSLADIAATASIKINQKAGRARSALKQLNGLHPGLKQDVLARQYNWHNIGLYLFWHDSLVYWNNAQIPAEASPAAFTAQQGFVKLRHGYYLYVKQTTKDTTALALCLVKPAYDLQNNYLKNYFAGWTGIPNEVELSASVTTGEPVLFNGQALFALKGNDESYAPRWAPNTWLALFGAGFCLLLLALLLLVKKGVGATGYALMVLGLPALRLLMLAYQWPAFFYKSILYDVHVFGDARSLLNPYLGDMVLNALVLLFVAVATHFYVAFGANRFSNGIKITSTLR